MDFNKRINLDSLIKIAKENKDKAIDKDTSEMDEVEKFILFFKIKEGKHKVFSSILREAFNKWACKELDGITFGKRFSKYFEVVKGDGRNHYLLNIHPTALLNKVEKLKVII